MTYMTKYKARGVDGAVSCGHPFVGAARSGALASCLWYPIIGNKFAWSARHLPLQHWSDDRIAESLRKHKGIILAVANELGYTREAIYLRIAKNDELRRVQVEARESMTDTAESALYKQIQRGEAWAVQFYLKTQGRARGYTDRQEIDIRVLVQQLAESAGLNEAEQVSAIIEAEKLLSTVKQEKLAGGKNE